MLLVDLLSLSNILQVVNRLKSFAVEGRPVKILLSSMNRIKVSSTISVTFDSVIFARDKTLRVIAVSKSEVASLVAVFNAPVMQVVRLLNQTFTLTVERFQVRSTNLNNNAF